MGVLLICDAPECFVTTPAVIKLGRVAQPDKWWMQPATSGRIVVGCCEDHFSAAVKAAR